jgi:hypothetical protein
MRLSTRKVLAVCPSINLKLKKLQKQPSNEERFCPSEEKSIPNLQKKNAHLYSSVITIE